MSFNALLYELNLVKQKNKKLRECVSFYANADNYSHDITSETENKAGDIIIHDDTYMSDKYHHYVGGKRAVQTLKELEEEK